MDTRMTLAQIEQTIEFKRLTPKQRLFLQTYIAAGAVGSYDAEAAIRTAYPKASDESVRTMAYSMMQSPRILDILNMHFGKTATDQFLEDVNCAIRNNKLSIAQLEALVLKSKILGIGTSINSRKASKMKKASKKKKNLKVHIPAPPPAAPPKQLW